jgi:hypothetical protein
MKYYALVPEAAGRFGPNTVFVDKIARPPLVEKFHYEFDGWLGDSLVETIGCYIVTEPLRDKIASANPTGVRFAEVEVSKSGEFIRRYPERALPHFVWLQITGVAGQDDFGYTITHGNAIVVSSRILDIMSGLGISHSAVVELENWKGGRAAIMEKIRQFKLKHPPPNA